MEAILKREMILNKAVCRTLGVFVFILLTALGAFVRIPLPFTPVPITLQTFFVLLSGAFLGGGLGVVVQLGYICLGVLGVPLFSGSGGGPLYLLGPTGGYLLGFVVANLLIARFIRFLEGSLIRVFILFALADLALLLSGTLWLRFILGGSFLRLVWLGFLPFIPGDLLKAAAAAIIYIKTKGRLRQIF